MGKLMGMLSRTGIWIVFGAVLGYVGVVGYQALLGTGTVSISFSGADAMTGATVGAIVGGLIGFFKRA